MKPFIDALIFSSALYIFARLALPDPVMSMAPFIWRLWLTGANNEKAGN